MTPEHLSQWVEHCAVYERDFAHFANGVRLYRHNQSLYVDRSADSVECDLLSHDADALRA